MLWNRTAAVSDSVSSKSASASPDRLTHFRHDVGLGTHPLVSARVRDHAEAAELVAPFDDGHVRLDRIAPSRDPERPPHIIARTQIENACATASVLSTRPDGIDEQRQAANRLRPEDDVCDARRPLQDRRAFLLRHASRHGDDRVVALVAGELAQLTQPRVQLLLGTLTDAAGVDHHEIRVGGGVCGLKTGLLEEARHPFRIVNVHLAAERLDEIFARHRLPMRPRRPRWFLAYGDTVRFRSFAFAFCHRFAFRLTGSLPQHLTRGAPKAIANRLASQHARELVDSTRLIESSDGRLGDRKSTRLNSSHDQISYAVFCLKKKKKI